MVFFTNGLSIRETGALCNFLKLLLILLSSSWNVENQNHSVAVLSSYNADFIHKKRVNLCHSESRYNLIEISDKILG